MVKLSKLERRAFVNKKNMTEADIRTKYITPAIESAGWDKMTQLREEYTFTAGPLLSVEN